MIPEGTFFNSFNDPVLTGRWRSPLPTDSTSKNYVMDFLFEDDGNCAINKIHYENRNGEWVPYSASQISIGDDDKWKTENGYLTIEVREPNLITADLMYRYRVDQDTLLLWQAEIFKGKGEGEGLSGEWSMSVTDHRSHTLKNERKYLFGEDGTLVTYHPGMKNDTNHYQIKGDHWAEIISTTFGHEVSPPDTVLHYFEVFPKMMGMFNKKPEFTLIKKKKTAGK